MPLVLPPGAPVVPAAPGLTGHRRTRFIVELLDLHDTKRGVLDGVAGGSLEYNYATRLRAGGRLQVRDTGQDIDWYTNRVRIGIEVNGIRWPLGVFLPTHSGDKWDGAGRSWDVELHSKLLILDQDPVVETYTVPAGANVLAAVAAVIGSADPTGAVSLPDIGDADALPSAMSWEPATPKLTIINDLLDAGGFFALTVDGTGQYVTGRYVRPSERPAQMRFESGESAIYIDDFVDAVDLIAIPNRVIVRGRGDGDAAGPVGVADNTNPNDPTSIPRRGRVVAKPYDGVEVTSVTAATLYAQKRLDESAKPLRKIEIRHAPVELATGDAVRFSHAASGISGVWVVDRTTVTVDPTALQSTVLREA